MNAAVSTLRVERGDQTERAGGARGDNGRSSWSAHTASISNAGAGSTGGASFEEITGGDR